MAETTVFQSGNSQAVRLPKEFRFKSKTVEIFRRGDEVVLREKRRTMADVLAELPPLTPEMADEIERVFEDIRDRRPPEERDWDTLWGEEKPPRARAAAKPPSRR
jgi:antitoxin VapB